MHTAPHRVCLTIDLAALSRNHARLRHVVSPCTLMPVLKANAYGLGVEPIAAALVAAGARRIGVAEPYEALQLQRLGVPIQILSSILPDEIDAMVEAGVILPVTDFETAARISRAAVEQNRTATIHFKIDTGMGRAGILWPEAPETIRRAAALPGLHLEGIFTHFPLAYESGSRFTSLQVQRLKNIIDALSADGITFAFIHAANSDAINNAPETLRAPFNLARSGINLHGAFDAAGSLIVRLEPVLNMTTRLAAVRTLPAGMSIGYGHTYHLPRALRVGTISAGYADGLPLALSNRGHVIIRGVACPILGRLSMDYTTVSLADVPDAAPGDTVTLLGTEGETTLHVQDWAAIKGTHAYDIICGIGSRVQRRYTGTATA